MRNALRQWALGDGRQARVVRKPDISFVVPHRGTERVPLLLSVLNSILAQTDVTVECIVVEQNQRREVDDLPDGVRYIHLPHPTDAAGWRKSWAFNVGVEAAQADIVVCHDGDILVPQRYAAEVLVRLGKGYEVAHLQRFLFCMGRSDTDAFLQSGVLSVFTPERVRQNWQGGTVAIRKDAFWRIGGYDERFVGWGGEDNEFYDRCRTISGWHSGYLPFVHLWHESQPEKMSRDRVANCQRLDSLLKRPADERIIALRARRSDACISPACGSDRWRLSPGRCNG